MDVNASESCADEMASLVDEYQKADADEGQEYGHEDKA
jgi:hypothetical protein